MIVKLKKELKNNRCFESVYPEIYFDTEFTFVKEFNCNGWGELLEVSASGIKDPIWLVKEDCDISPEEQFKFKKRA